MRLLYNNLLKRVGAAAISAVLLCGWAPTQVYAEEGDMKACYSGFFYGRGWSGEYEDNTLGKAPADSYVTAVRVSLRNQPAGMTGTVAYQVNSSGQGWLDWVENQMDGGITDTEFPLEAVRMKLTGDLAEHYDVYYSVLQSAVWTPWAKNEETAGVENQGLRVDGFKVSVVKKGGAQPPDVPEPVGVDPTKPMIALTFDDGPNTGVTGRILDVLEAGGGKATFFMVGNRVPGNADVVRRMAALGYEVGNHTYDHKYLTGMSDAEIQSSVGQTNSNIESAAGVAPAAMRPTGGYYDTPSLNTLGAMGMPAVMWSIDTLDWKTLNADETVKAVLDHVQDGDIILMHDIYGTTADAVEVLVPELAARGYQMVTVSELAAARGGMEPGRIYGSFRPQ